MKDRLTQANNSSEKTSEELIPRTQVDNKESLKKEVSESAKVTKNQKENNGQVH